MAGFSFNPRNCRKLTMKGDIELAGNRVYPFKTVTSDPVLPDLANGEFVICDVVAGNKRLYWRTGDVLYYVTLTPA